MRLGVALDDPRANAVARQLDCTEQSRRSRPDHQYIRGHAASIVDAMIRTWALMSG
jgi:hypothetical protein